MKRVVVLILGLLVAVGCASTPPGDQAGVVERAPSAGGGMAPPQEPAAVQAEHLPPAANPVDREGSDKGRMMAVGGGAQAPPSAGKPPDSGQRSRAPQAMKRPAPLKSAAARSREEAPPPVTETASEAAAEERVTQTAPLEGGGNAAARESAESGDAGGVESAALVIPPSVAPPAVVPPVSAPRDIQQGGAELPAPAMPGEPGETPPSARGFQSAPSQQPGVLPAGTVLEVRLAERLSTESHRTGDRFRAILDRDVELPEGVVIPRGTMVEGEVTEAVAPGKVKGKSRLSITLERLMIDGRALGLRTNEISLEAEGSAKEDLKPVGIGTAVGSALGAIFGGKKGAAVGAAAGAGAGTARVLTTEGKHVEIPRERLFSFRLEEPVELTGR